MKAILAALVLGASLLTQSADAQVDMCRAIIAPDVVSAEQEVLHVGDTYRMQLAFGAGSITVGAPAQIAIHAVRFLRNCHSFNSWTPIRCTEPGNLVAYLGDETITTTCAGVTWRTSQPAGTGSSVITFVPDAPVVISQNCSPRGAVPCGNCDLEFDLQLIKANSAVVHEIAAYGLGDLECSNGLNATDIQEIGVHVE